jgi:hypothetical protein
MHLKPTAFLHLQSLPLVPTLLELHVLHTMLTQQHVPPNHVRTIPELLACLLLETLSTSFLLLLFLMLHQSLCRTQLAR